MELPTDQLSILFRVFVAIILSGVVGYEREHLHKPAGLRTNMIIGGAACLIASLTPPLILFIEHSNARDLVSTDPIRLLQALVVGISFIGAGTIIKGSGEKKISGLTTAATLLFSMGIGVAAAIEQYIVAVGITLIVLIVNVLVRRLTYKLPLPNDESHNPGDED